MLCKHLFPLRGLDFYFVDVFIFLEVEFYVGPSWEKLFYRPVVVVNAELFLLLNWEQEFLLLEVFLVDKLGSVGEKFYQIDNKGFINGVFILA